MTCGHSSHAYNLELERFECCDSRQCFCSCRPAIGLLQVIARKHYTQIRNEAVSLGEMPVAILVAVVSLSDGGLTFVSNGAIRADWKEEDDHYVVAALTEAARVVVARQGEPA